MRVLHLTRDLPPHASGGVSTAVHGLVAALVRHGCECAVLSFDGWRPHSRPSAAAPARSQQEDGILVSRVHDPQQAHAALPGAAAWRPQVIHVHHDMLWSFAGELTARTAAAATCCTIHVLQHALNRLRGVHTATRSLRGQHAALASADAVIAPSRAVENGLLREHPELAPRLHRIGFGATAQPPPAAERRGPPILLYSGRFADVKGTAELARAANRLLARHLELAVVVAGGNPQGPRSDRRWRRLFARWIAPELQHRLRLTGWLQRADLDVLYREATALLCPSWYESFGLTALEAMAHGVAVIAGNAGALPELVVHEHTGLLVTPGSVDELVEQAERLLGDPALARRLGREGWRRAMRDFGWAPVATAHDELYRRLAGPTPCALIR